MLPGILNIGNTCAINSLLQCFAHTKLLRTFFTEHKIRISYNGRYSITHELVKVLREMWGGGDNHNIAPQTFLQAFYEKFGNVLRFGEQHDICEVCTLLCERVAEECFEQEKLAQYDIVPTGAYADIHRASLISLKSHNRNTESVWLDNMQGVLLVCIRCNNPDCKKEYHTFEPFIVLLLEIPDSARTIYDCLDATFKHEAIQDWKCDRCKSSHGGTKHTRLWKIPRMLCISFKRFMQVNETIAKNRIHIDISTAMYIDRQSVVGPRLHQDKHISYTLSSVALHHGGLMGGHYTAICKEHNETWTHYDDTHRTSVPHPSVDEVYMLVYES
jgi:ubiquitin C-terminal hydrolase